MHFYQKNIGDFNNATRHLTRVERSLFSDAIELYYDTEKPLTSDINKLNRLLLAHSQEEKDALLAVLAEFFTLTDEGYFNKRCNEEILKYQAYMESKSKAGKASAEQRAKQKATGVEQVLNTTSTKQNQEPITINHKTNKTPTQKADAFVPPDWINKSHWEIWHKHPKRKNLTNEQKQLAVDKLSAWRDAGLDYANSLEITAMNNYQGLIEPKQSLQAKPAKQSRMDISGIDYTAGVNADGSF